MTTATATPATYGRDASIAKFTVARYQRMIETGILNAADKVELLENYVVLKMAKNPSHDGTIDLMKTSLMPLLPTGWLLRVQQTVVLSDSQPEPDGAVVRGNSRSFLTRHPGPADVGLMIEIAESSLLRDQQDKTRIYARAGLPYYWVINLVDHRIESYTQPSGPAATPVYNSLQIYQPGDMVPLILDGVLIASIAATDLLP